MQYLQITAFDVNSRKSNSDEFPVDVNLNTKVEKFISSQTYDEFSIKTELSEPDDVDEIDAAIIDSLNLKINYYNF